jgi:hypothetical protein
MVYTIAHIKNGVVDNICVWDRIPSKDELAGFELVNITDSEVSIGWEYAEGVFTDPNDLTRVWSVSEDVASEEVEPEPLPEETPPEETPE